MFSTELTEGDQTYQYGCNVMRDVFWKNVIRGVYYWRFFVQKVFFPRCVEWLFLSQECKCSVLEKFLVQLGIEFGVVDGFQCRSRWGVCLWKLKSIVQKVVC